jgi:hypothetical protein
VNLWKSLMHQNFSTFWCSRYQWSRFMCQGWGVPRWFSLQCKLTVSLNWFWALNWTSFRRLWKLGKWV